MRKIRLENLISLINRHMDIVLKHASFIDLFYDHITNFPHFYQSFIYKY